MDIEGLDYNTQREPLVLPIYGRAIQNMVDFTIMLPTKELRQRGANTIIALMATKQPQTSADGNRILWDHLFLMGRNKLDIDWPYDICEATKILLKPKPMPLKNKNEHVRLRHYGRLLETMFQKLQQMPEGKERDALTSLVANQMKLCLTIWGHGSNDDWRVAEDLARLTNGVIRLDLNTFKFDKLPLDKVQQPKEQQRKKKK